MPVQLDLWASLSKDSDIVGLVGILNVTPDSFSDGGLFDSRTNALIHAQKLFDDGAELVDIGAESTNPKSHALTADQEWSRLRTILPELISLFPGKLSLDTYHPETAEQALQLGDLIINDVSGLKDPRMVEVILKHSARVIISHCPADIPIDAHSCAIDDINLVKHQLIASARQLEKRGLPRDHIVLDPGIGFGKTMRLNEELLSFAAYMPEYNVMIGYSRKRFSGEKRMELTTNITAGQVAINAGARYLRVHDVDAHHTFLTT